jgi:hypothetical protein
MIASILETDSARESNTHSQRSPFPHFARFAQIDALSQRATLRLPQATSQVNFPTDATQPGKGLSHG